MAGNMNIFLSSACGKISTVTVSVIANDLSSYKTLKSDSPHPDIVKMRCQHLLLNQILATDQAISFSKSKLGKAYGIDCIIIKSIDLKSSQIQGHFTEGTEIIIESLHSKDFFILYQELLRNETHLAGVSVELDRLYKLLWLTTSRNLLSQSPIGALLHGPPGCGKSSLVRSVAISCDAVLLSLDASQVLQSEFGAGAEAVKSYFSKATSLTEEGRVILFLDEIDVFCPNASDSSLGVRQITNALISELDKVHKGNISGLFVIGATNHISSVAKSLRRPGRFDQEILMNVPSQTQRSQILQLISQSYHLNPSVCLENVALRTAGFVGADLKALFEEAASNAFLRSPQQNNRSVIEMTNFEHALHVVTPSLRKGLDCTVDLQPVHWDDIGGLEDTKTEIQQSIEWPLLHSDALKRMDLAPTKGILLYGPPGCCKTTLVKAAATSCHVNFLSLTGAQVFSPYVGQSEKIVSEAFQKARALSPSILFFDEIETLVGNRSSKGSHNNVQERILATLLNEMDGVGVRLDKKMDMSSSRPKEEQRSIDTRASEKTPLTMQDEGSKQKAIIQSQVIVVGATNRPDMVDAALLRPGRLDKLIYVPPPDLQARKAILKVFTNKMATSSVDIDALCQDTENYSGADLKNLCKEAGLLALREQLSQQSDNAPIKIYHRHFKNALKTVQPSLTNDVINLYCK